MTLTEQVAALCSDFEKAKANYLMAKTVDVSQQACRDGREAETKLTELASQLMASMLTGIFDPDRVAALTYYNTWKNLGNRSF